jgi:hypothetical protein
LKKPTSHTCAGKNQIKIQAKILYEPLHIPTENLYQIAPLHCFVSQVAQGKHFTPELGEDIPSPLSTKSQTGEHQKIFLLLRGICKNKVLNFYHSRHEETDTVRILRHYDCRQQHSEWATRLGASIWRSRVLGGKIRWFAVAAVRWFLFL